MWEVLQWHDMDFSQEQIRQKLQINPHTGFSDDYKNKLTIFLSCWREIILPSYWEYIDGIKGKWYLANLELEKSLDDFKKTMLSFVDELSLEQFDAEVAKINTMMKSNIENIHDDIRSAMERFQKRFFPGGKPYQDWLIW